MSVWHTGIQELGRIHHLCSLSPPRTKACLYEAENLPAQATYGVLHSSLVCLQLRMMSQLCINHYAAPIYALYQCSKNGVVKRKRGISI